jgi:hypothetical protein
VSWFCLRDEHRVLTTPSDTAWERIQLSHDQKRGIWGTENGMILLKDNLSVLRKQVPSQREPAHEVFKKNEPLFLGLDLFFVKVRASYFDEAHHNLLTCTDI